jgi:hypothetical protein
MAYHGKVNKSSGLTMAGIQATLDEFERRFPRKAIAGKLVMRQSTLDIIKKYIRIQDSKSLGLMMPFEGVVCEIDETIADREVRVLNLDGEIIQTLNYEYGVLHNICEYLVWGEYRLDK